LTEIYRKGEKDGILSSHSGGMLKHRREDSPSNGRKESLILSVVKEEKPKRGHGLAAVAGE